MKKEQIQNFLTSLSDSITEGNKKLYSSIMESSGIEKIETPEEFYFAVVYPFEKFIDGFIQTEISNNDDVVFIVSHSEYINRHFTRLFVDIEGSACSADKARTIVKRLLQFYKDGTRIEFDYAGKYTYHLPKKIFKEHEHIVDFYTGLKYLFYGDNRRYLAALKQVLSDKEQTI